MTKSTPTLPRWVRMLGHTPKWGIWTALVVAGTAATAGALTAPEFADGTKEYKAAMYVGLVLLWVAVAVLCKWTAELWRHPTREDSR